MKTITLKQAYQRATEGPYKSAEMGFKNNILNIEHTIFSMSDAEIVPAVAHAKTPAQASANAALLAHAYNVLPELVDALNLAFEDACREERSQELIDALDVVLTKANTVHIP